MNFRPRAPLVPKGTEPLAFQATEGVRHVAEQTAKAEVVNGAMTAETTLKAAGTAQTIEHKLGRMPIGWLVAGWTGFEPRFRVVSMTAKRLSIVSQDCAELRGTFTTGPTGATSGNGYGWTVSRTAAGVYTFVLADSFTGILSGSVVSSLGNALRGFRYTSFTAPSTVVFSHWNDTPALANCVSSTVLVSLGMTGTGSKFKLWVF